MGSRRCRGDSHDCPHGRDRDFAGRGDARRGENLATDDSTTGRGMLLLALFLITWQDHLARGEALRLAGRLVDAQAELTQAVAADPRDAIAQEALGVVELQLGRPGAALAPLQRAAELDASKADHHYNLGIALAQLKRSADALGAFRRALALDPNHAAAHHNLAHTLINQGSFDEALTELERAIAI